MTPFCQYVAGVLRLHDLAVQGQAGSTQAAEVRDTTDGSWKGRDAAERELASALGAVLESPRPLPRA